jgi:hypothetical protein
MGARRNLGFVYPAIFLRRRFVSTGTAGRGLRLFVVA